jgi:HJR/Mrr/RecB family endonuclease
MKYKSFHIVLRDLMLKNNITPGALASMLDVKAVTVDNWLSTQLPKISTTWRIAKQFQCYELVEAATGLHHLRMQNKYDQSNKPILIEKSASTYFGNSNFMAMLDDSDRKQFFQIWENVLKTDYNSPIEDQDDAEDESIILPPPSIIMYNDWKYIIDQIAADGKELYKLDWKKFEDLIAHILAEHGWEATPMGYTKDNGIDIIAVQKIVPDINIKMMVQCKRLSHHRRVGIEVVREVWSVKWKNAFNLAMIATTSQFTKGAKDEGHNWNFALKDHDNILNMCKELTSVKNTPKICGLQL